MKTATSTALAMLMLIGSASAQSTLQRPTTTTTTARPDAVTPLPVGTSGSSTTASDYRLAAGDKLRVEVYKDSQLSQSLQIRPDGKITLPLVGDVTAAGRTSMELRDAIVGALADYIKDPTVTVMVVETAPQVVYVMGEVTKPGTLAIVNGHMTILQALAMAGGFTDFANRKDIRILRKGPSGMQTLKFNYKDAMDDGNHREPLALLPGDTVIVK